MSSRLVTKIQDIKVMSGKHKRVLQAWAAFANNDGTNIYAAKESVAAKAGISRTTVYHNTDDLMKVGILVQAEKHTCKIPNCNKGGTHFSGRWGRYTIAYDINVSALENKQTLLFLNQLKVDVSKRIKVGVQKQLKDGVSKLDATLSLGDSGQEPTHSATHVAVVSEQASQVADCVGSSSCSPASAASWSQGVCEHSCSLTVECPLCWDDTSLLPVHESRPTPESAAPLPRPSDEFYEDALKFLGYCFPIDSEERNLARLPDAIRAFKAYAAQCPDFKCDCEVMWKIWEYNHTHKKGTKLYCQTMKQFSIACESPSENNLIQQSWDHLKEGPCAICDKEVWERHRAQCEKGEKCICGPCERHAARHESGFSVAGYKDSEGFGKKVALLT